MMGLMVFVLVLFLIFREFGKLQYSYTLSFKDFKLSFKSIFMNYIGVVGLVIGVAYIFKLKLVYLVYLIATAVASVFLMSSYLYKFKNNVASYHQITMLLMHISSNFKNDQKIIAALSSVLPLANESNAIKLSQMITKLEEGEDIIEVSRILSPHYLAQSLFMVMHHAQQYGDDYIDTTLNIIEEDLDDWHDHVENFIQAMNDLRKRIMLLTLFGLVVSLVSQNMLHMVADLTHLSFYQFAVYAFMSTMICIVAFSHKILCINLIMDEECMT